LLLHGVESEEHHAGEDDDRTRKQGPRQEDGESPSSRSVRPKGDSAGHGRDPQRKRSDVDRTRADTSRAGTSIGFCPARGQEEDGEQAREGRTCPYQEACRTEASSQSGSGARARGRYAHRQEHPGAAAYGKKASGKENRATPQSAPQDLEANSEAHRNTHVVASWRYRTPNNDSTSDNEAKPTRTPEHEQHALNGEPK